jgi:transcription termination/antitermination protein NusA
MVFESITGAKVKDCISGERLTFIVEENQMGKAIGKNGINIRNLEQKLKKKVKVAEFSTDVLQFIRNFLYPNEVMNIAQDEGIITITGTDTSSKALIIGREKQKLNNLTNIVKRYFDIKEIKVV